MIKPCPDGPQCDHKGWVHTWSGRHHCGDGPDVAQPVRRWIASDSAPDRVAPDQADSGPDRAVTGPAMSGGTPRHPRSGARRGGAVSGGGTLVTAPRPGRDVMEALVLDARTRLRPAARRSAAMIERCPKATHLQCAVIRTVFGPVVAWRPERDSRDITAVDWL